MTIPNFDGIKELIVDFEEIRYGLLYFTITLGDKSFKTNFSDVFDPILNFKRWLEAICIGVEQCSFSYDPERDEIKFNVESISYDRDIFTVSYYCGDDETLLSDYVDRRQIVSEFYLGLLNFRDSPKFEKYQWEKEVFADRLTNLLGIGYESLITELAKLGRKQLNDWLCKADPRRLRPAPAEDEEADLAILLKSELSNSEKTFNRESDRSEIEWNIPLDYSNWNVDEKRKLVEECLSENCSLHEGIKIKDFKSKIIEDYLNHSLEPKKVNGSIK